MPLPLDREIAHLPLDHAGIGSVPAFRVELITDLGEQHLVVITTVGEGGKIPVSTRETG